MPGKEFHSGRLGFNTESRVAAARAEQRGVFYVTCTNPTCEKRLRKWTARLNSQCPECGSAVKQER